ncbi:transporter substrate-binding domain-containing protein [Breoghania sp.]|uniref:transporter substrate-binding domain-containing protein n=1 Tax=Breoghania sp. TaxID=2065378 RepID=UPI0026048FCC|nr:transporter substrate-binding domain-containing protein [Breoghania sp.]MDJ0931742.1 transporter substrate-binding domain-containing protein [Breoghania sp.]
MVDRTELRIRADPGNLPYSNDRGEGFENRIAEIIGEELGLPVRYTWFPQTIGFVRRTLGEKRCDLIIGVTATNEVMQNTNPYYNSTYVMVHRKDTVLSGSLGDQALKGLTIGAQPRTPVVSLLARHGLLGHMKSYVPDVDGHPLQRTGLETPTEPHPAQAQGRYRRDPGRLRRPLLDRKGRLIKTAAGPKVKPVTAPVPTAKSGAKSAGGFLEP